MLATTTHSNLLLYLAARGHATSDGQAAAGRDADDTQSVGGASVPVRHEGPWHKGGVRAHARVQVRTQLMLSSMGALQVLHPISDRGAKQ